MDFITILSIIPIVLSALGVIIAIVGLLLGIRILKLERQITTTGKQLKVLDQYKDIFILQMVLFGETEVVHGYEALELIKRELNTKDDFQALRWYYNHKKENAN